MTYKNIAIPPWHSIDTAPVITAEAGEPLIQLECNRDSRIQFEPKYHMKQIPGAITQCFMRQAVYAKLSEALKLLPEGYGFKIFDAWRTFSVQDYLYRSYVDNLIAFDGKTPDEAFELAKKFVSYPSTNPLQPFVHATGGAIDLTIIDSNNCELDMGTDFDDFTPLAHTDHFEASDNELIKSNRRLLYHSLTSVGFTNYPSEWWHYDFGDAFWASETKKNTAIYGGINKI